MPDDSVTPARSAGSPPGLPFWTTFGVLAAITVWAYWGTLEKTAERWSTDPQYSHGYLVPAFAAYLLYRRRGMLAGHRLAPSLGAVVPMLIAVALRFAETIYYYNGLDPLSLVPAFAAVLLAAGGWPAFRWGWPAAAFCVFMVPLPYRMQTYLSGELQSVATNICTYILVTLGYPAVSEGNVIVMNEVRIGVVEACSGLGMVMTFAALSAGFALLMRMPVWAKVVLLLGALPTAVVANVFRICATAILYDADQGEAARQLYHDLAGWIMIPLGCVLILVEVWVLDHILLPAEPAAVRAAPLNAPPVASSGASSSARPVVTPAGLNLPGNDARRRGR